MSEPRASPEPQGDGRVRAVVESISPSVDGGRFAVKRVVGDKVEVEADCFADGHDVLAARLLWRPDSERAWREAPMTPIGNDRWRGSFVVGTAGRYRYTVTAWVDGFLSWRHDFARRVDPEDIRVAALVGAELVEQAAARAADADRAPLAETAKLLRRAEDPEALRRAGLDEALAALAGRYPDRRFAFTYPIEFPLVVDRERAHFSTWYEMFPRSASPEPGRHGTFRDCEARLPYVAAMGFDVLYLPPIHPIGRDNRKGPNNALAAGRTDVGSPWAIGAAEGGHKAMHPELGTLEDFRRLVARGARARHRDRARHRLPVLARPSLRAGASRSGSGGGPTASMQYAENPPKKYQDIYPFDFESDDWRGAVGRSCASVFDFWIAEGVRIFRVDNPHTKPFAFWEWAIAEVKRAASRGDLPRRGVHAAEGHVPPGEARLHAVVHVLHVAQHEARAHRVLHRARRTVPGASTSARTSGRTRPTSSPSTCSSAAGRRSSRGSCSPRRSRRATASTGRRSSCSSTRRASRAARSTSTPRSTSCATGISIAPTASPP